jgi:hypothetical protein
MGSIVRRLRPTEREVSQLACRETDPRHIAQFTPITRGPVLAVLALLGIGLAAILCAPFWLLRPRQ